MFLEVKLDKERSRWSTCNIDIKKQQKQEKKRNNEEGTF